MSEKPRVFVIMPFDAEFNSIFNKIIKPALEGVGYDVLRADSLIDRHNILKDIVRGIATAQLIIADLTAQNPNVLYELGLAHGLEIPTVLIAQSMDEIPFDLRPYRIEIYSTHFDEVEKLKQKLADIGEKHQMQAINYSSPVTDFLPKSEDLPNKITQLVKEETVKEIVEEIEEKGFLDYVIDGNEAIEEFNQIMIAIASETENIGEKIQLHTQRSEEISQNQGPGTAKEIRNLVFATATDMSNYAEKIEEALPELKKQADLLTEGLFGYVSWFQPKTKEEKAQVEEFRETISGLLEGTSSALEGTRSFRDSVAGLKGISKELNRASRRIVKALDGVIAVIENIEAFSIKTLVLIDEKIGIIGDPPN